MANSLSRETLSHTNMNPSDFQLQTFLNEFHAIPADMLDLVRRIAAYDAALLASLDQRYFSAWQSGRELAEGRGLLQAIAAYVVSQQAKQPHAT